MGLTTMPSPPAMTSSSHQVVAAAVEAGSVVSTRIRRVAMINSGSARASRSAQSRCHGADVRDGRPLRWPAAGTEPPVRRPARPSARRSAGRPCVNASALASRARVRSTSPPRSTPAALGRSSADTATGNDGPSRRADRRVLIPKQPLGLDAPRHQLGIEQHPGRVQLVEQPGLRARCAQSVHQPRGQLRRRRTTARSASTPHRARPPAPRTGPAPPSRSRQTRATARDPMCFSSQITCVTPLGPVRGEGLRRVLEQRPGATRWPPGPWSAAGRPASGDRWQTGSSPPAPRPHSPRARRSAAGRRFRSPGCPAHRPGRAPRLPGSTGRRGPVGRKRLGRCVVDLAAGTLTTWRSG